MIENEQLLAIRDSVVSKLETLLLISRDQPVDEEGDPIIVDSAQVVNGEVEDTWYRTGKFTIALGSMELLVSMSQIEDERLLERIADFRKRVDSAEFTQRLKTKDDVDFAYKLVEDVVVYMKEKNSLTDQPQ